MTRHFWVLIHRYAGLYMAFFLLVAGLTGSIMAFEIQIQNWLNPPVTVVSQAVARQEALTLRDYAQALVPQGRTDKVAFAGKPDEAYTVLMVIPSEASTGKPEEIFQLSLNPYTGKEMAREKVAMDDFWPVTRKNFIPLIVALHYRLALPGSIGIWLFGINFDLHRAGGLWVWLMLLVLAWSSVGFNLSEQVYTPVMKSVFNMPDPYGDLPALETPQPEPALDWSEAHRIGRKLMSEQASINGFSVLREEALQYNAEKGVFFYIVHSDRDLIDEGGSIWLLLDGATGKFAGINIPTGQNAGTTLDNWIFALHMAMIWGLPFKVFVCVVGVVIVMLTITGVYIWFKKLRARCFMSC